MFTPIQTLAGGALLHFASSTLLADTGRVLGISGILDGALFGSTATPGTRGWRWSMLAGLLLGPLAFDLVTNHFDALPKVGLGVWEHVSVARLSLAGLLVGLGSRLGSGCTSGHFLCGVSRLSPRSLVATASFFTTAVLTANIAPLPYPPTLDAPAYTLSTPANWAPYALLVVGALVLHRIQRAVINGTGSYRLVPYLTYGLVFSIGLCVSGMASPIKVVSFLRLIPIDRFDPSLAMVFVTGVIPNGIHYALKRQQLDKPRFPWERSQIPKRSDITWRLVVGSVIFGLGWGLVGVCPGPAIVALPQIVLEAVNSTGSSASILRMCMGWGGFAGSMILGFGVGRAI